MESAPDMTLFIAALVERLRGIVPSIAVEWSALASLPDHDRVRRLPGGQVEAELRGVGTISFDPALCRLRLSRPSDAPGRDRRSVALLSLASALVAAVAGHTTLHANGLVLGTAAGERTYGLVGPSGLGKTTLTLYAMRQGHRLLGDDVLAVAPDGSVTGLRPFLHPTDVALRGLGFGAHPTAGKAYVFPSAFGLSAQVGTAPRLDALFFLREAPEVTVETRADLGSLLFEALRNSVFMAPILAIDRQALDRLMAVLAGTSVALLAYPRRFDALPEVLAALEGRLTMTVAPGRQ